MVKLDGYVGSQAFFDGSGENAPCVLRPPPMTPSQCRAGRALLDWSQQKLADAANVGIGTVRQFEAGATQPRKAIHAAMQHALESAGIVFTNGESPGVRIRKP